MDCRPPGSPIFGKSPVKNTGVGCHALLSDSVAQENKVCHCFHFFHNYLPRWNGTRGSTLYFLNVISQRFHSPLSPSSKCSLVPLHCAAIGVVSSAYLRLLIFLPAILIPVELHPCISHYTFFMWVKYSGWQYTTLTFSFLNFEPVCCSMSGSNCCFLTCVQVSQEADKVVWYSLLFKNFPWVLVIHTVKGFSVVN